MKYTNNKCSIQWVVTHEILLYHKCQLRLETPQKVFSCPFLINPHTFVLSCETAAKSLQSCPTLCDPRDGCLPGSPVPGILQARTLEWVAISFSNAWKWKVKGKSLSYVQLLAIPWTAAHQAPPSMGFSRQEYWSRVSLPSPCPQRNPLFWIFYNNYSCLVEKLINGITQYMFLCFNIFEIHPYHYIYQYFVSYYFWEIQCSSVAQSRPTL